MSAIADELHKDIDRDFNLRSIGQLRVTNMRGDVSIQGWALDKIRVKARKKSSATGAETQKLFDAMDINFQQAGSDVELSAEYGKGLSITERLKEREHPKTAMEIIVFAPVTMKLKVWAVNGKVTIKSWSAPVEVRTVTGGIQVEGVKGDNVSLLCSSCSMKLKSIHASIRCMNGTGEVDIDTVKGPNIYVESSSGTLRAKQIDGQQFYVSKTGSLIGKDLSGQIEFHVKQGSVEIIRGAGFLSGKTESGDILAKMTEWRFFDKALIESIQGSIKLFLPISFAADVDFWSQKGKTTIGFPIEKSDNFPVKMQDSSNHTIGRIGGGGEQLKIYSESGDISVFRGSD